MATSKEESEAFNILNLMYQDDDDDMEEPEGGNDEDVQEDAEPQIRQLRSDGIGLKVENREDQKSKGTDTDFPGLALGGTPMRQLHSRPTIVHDEVAMSPKAEEGDCLGNVEAMHAEDAKNAHAVVHENALSGNVWMTTPSIHLTSRPSVRVEDSEYDAEENDSTWFEKEDFTGVNNIENMDPLGNFLPPTPNTKCSMELQEKRNKFLAYMRQKGKSFNAEVRKRKDYGNPDFLLQAVSYQDIDQIGSCLSKYVFDPHGYDKSDYYDAIEADMKSEMERKEQEKKKNPVVEFVSGGSGSQLASILAASKISMSVSGVSNLAFGGLQSASAEATPMEGRQNKKSKWDKVDGDQRTALTGGQSTQAAAAAHETVLSTANVRSGYTTSSSMQQRRRES